MKLLVVLGHPSEKSFNHAIAKTTVSKLLENGHGVIFHGYRKMFRIVVTSTEAERKRWLHEVEEIVVVIKVR